MKVIFAFPRIKFHCILCLRIFEPPFRRAVQRFRGNSQQSTLHISSMPLVSFCAPEYIFPSLLSFNLIKKTQKKRLNDVQRENHTRLFRDRGLFSSLESKFGNRVRIRTLFSFSSSPLIDSIFRKKFKGSSLPFFFFFRIEAQNIQTI